MSQGQTKKLKFTTNYSADWSVTDKQGDPISVADIGAATFLLKKSVEDEDGDAVLTKTLYDGISAAAGYLMVAIDPADTIDIQGTYVGTLKVTLTSGSQQPVYDNDHPDDPLITITIRKSAVKAIA